MRPSPRETRARLWVLVYLALFGDDTDDTDDSESTTGASESTPSDGERSGE
jgi:hypothetical protein